MSNTKIDIKKLTESVLQEGTPFSTSNDYVFPGEDGDSQILLYLCIGVIKNNAIEYVTGVNLDEKQNETMLEAGKKVIKGTMTPETYMEKLLSMLKIKNLDGIAKNQILMRLAFSYGKNRGVADKTKPDKAKFGGTK